MIIVTGGAGFIGSNIIKQLNESGVNDIIVVDNLTNGQKFRNIAALDIYDYIDKEDFIELVRTRNLDLKCDCIFHMGACSTTTEWDGKYMMKNNYEYSKTLYHWANDLKIPFLYASSAAVYGGSSIFKEAPEYEKPLNVYGYSKLLFDNYIRKQSTNTQVVGFRFFNVYGPGESHKGGMASVAFHHHNQLQVGDKVKLFGAFDGYEAGEQKRDFVYVKDVVKAMLWVSQHPEVTGIYNLGTGRAQSFNDVANAVISFHEKGSIEYVDFPEQLKKSYQSFTQADMTQLREAGFTESFMTVKEGVKDYLKQII